MTHPGQPQDPYPPQPPQPPAPLGVSLFDWPHQPAPGQQQQIPHTHVSPPPAHPAYGPLAAPAPRKENRRGLWIAIGASIVGTIVVVAISATMFVFATGGGPFASLTGPTIEDARRECRTAFNDEFSRRDGRALAGTSSSTGVLASVTDIKLEESRRTSSRTYEVNGTVYYDLTATLIPTVHSTLSLTCQATVSGQGLTTEVRNR